MIDWAAGAAAARVTKTNRKQMDAPYARCTCVPTSFGGFSSESQLELNGAWRRCDRKSVGPALARVGCKDGVYA